MPPIDPDDEFDLIVVGSGNGACGFLGECLKHVPEDYRVLVLEEGDNFFFTSLSRIRMGGPRATPTDLHSHFTTQLLPAANLSYLVGQELWAVGVVLIIL